MSCRNNTLDSYNHLLAQETTKMKSKTWIRSLVFLQSNQLKKAIVRILKLKTFSIILLPIATSSAFAAPVTPSLIIPDGSYLDNTALIGIVFFNGDLSYYRHGDSAVIFRHGAAMRCWLDGHDITYTPSTATFACDTSITRHPDKYVLKNRYIGTSVHRYIGT